MRSALPKEDVLNRSKLICDNFADLLAFNESKKIAIYFPINNEVDTIELFKKNNTQ